MASSDMLKDVNHLNVFGKCDETNIISIAHEKREKAKEFYRLQKEKKKELKLQEELKKLEEIEFQNLLMEEEEKNRAAYYIPPPSCGRGRFMNGAVGFDRRPRGRGRLGLEEGWHPHFEIEQKVQGKLDNLGESIDHNNKLQMDVWCIRPASDEEEDPVLFTQENYTRYTPESSSTPDQFDDAFSTSQSASPLSFSSVKSKISGSPNSSSWPSLEPPAAAIQPPPRPEASPTIPHRQKSRKNRLAAKFSNSMYEDTEQNNKSGEEAVGFGIGKKENHEGSLEAWGSSQPASAPYGLRNGRKSTGMSINDLRPSQRMLSNNILPQEKIFYGSVGGRNKDFTLNMKDFPAL